MTKITQLCTPRDLKFITEHEQAQILMSKTPGLGFIQALAHIRSGAPSPLHGFQADSLGYSS